MPFVLRKILLIYSFCSFSIVHSDMKLGIQMYHNNILVKFCFGYDMMTPIDCKSISFPCTVPLMYTAHNEACAPCNICPRGA